MNNKLKIAVIDNYDSFVYNLIRYLKEENETEITVMRNDNIDYSVLDQADGILLSPGPGIPDEAGDLKKVITEYYQKKNMLGVCLGHQALAEFFGSKLEKCVTPIHGESSEINILKTNKIFSNLPSKIQVGRYHSWKVKNIINDKLVFTAFTQEKEIMALKHKIYPLYGVQFHPESILTPNGRQIIKNWLNEIQISATKSKRQKVVENNS
ncbi:MAG: aminodeoxychorismate/anthranilate synthase component II [Bacteroidota bacterium]